MNKQKSEIINEIKYELFGLIHWPFKDPKGTPIQPSVSTDINGIAKVFQEHTERLRNLDGFSHIVLV